MDKKSDFVIVPYRNEYVLSNSKGSEDQHTHIRRGGTCKLLIKLVCNKIVPNSGYLRTSAMRITRDEKYRRAIQRKIEKDADKQKYYNVQKGRRRRG